MKEAERGGNLVREQVLGDGDGVEVGLRAEPVLLEVELLSHKALEEEEEQGVVVLLVGEVLAKVLHPAPRV